MRIVVLTSHDRVTPLLLPALRARGMVPDAIVVASYIGLAECFRPPPGRARVAEWPVAVARSLWRRVRPRLNRTFRVGRRLIVSGSLRSPQLRLTLERLSPDLLVLARCGLIPPDVIATARVGVINAHPGLLPWLRNNGVVGRAILQGLPVGTTVHRVDAGIDTGAVIRRRLVRVTSAARSLSDLERAADITAAELLADVVVETVAQGRLASGEQQRTRFPLQRWLTLEERRAADQRIAAGEAKATFEEWARLANPVSLDLPSALGLTDGADEPAHSSGPE